MEDYEKKYKQALENAKRLYEQGTITESLAYIFPELRGDEDERIRKCLIGFFEDWHENRSHCWGIAVTDILAWLEKQGEQKPVDKVEPFDKYEGLTDFERTLADICIGWIGEELGWKQYIKDNADVLLKIAIKKFNSIQDAPFKQKPAAWSEEDEKMYKIALSCIETLEDISNGKNMHADVKDWLKSLKDRIGG